MAYEKGESPIDDLEPWLESILKKSESFQGTEAEKQANDEQLFQELFDGLVKLFRTNPDLGKDIQPSPPIANQGILRGSLFVYAQVYYKIIEAVSSGEVAYADLLLNQYYLQVVKKIKYLLSLDEFKSFTGEFYPPEHILPSCGLGDIGWEDGIAPQTESFLVSVQTFMNELDFKGNEPVEVTLVLKWLRKNIDPIMEKVANYNQTTKRYFNGLMKNLMREKEKVEKVTNRKEQRQPLEQDKPCTNDEYNRFVLIYRRLKDLIKLLRNKSVEDEDKIVYKQIELEEDLIKFWPTVENIGRGVGIDVSGKLDMIKEIIYNKDIQTFLDNIDPGMMSCGLTIDGKYYDEIELDAMMRDELDKGERMREDLIKGLDRMMVRLDRSFGVNEEAKMQFKTPSKDTTHDQVFICYSHKDQKWLDDLQTHLKPYMRNGLTAWSDKQIVSGSKWLPAIETSLASAKVAVMLVSPNFLASDFIHEKELGPLLKKAEKDKVKIIWLPIRACSYKETPLKDYQAAIDPEKPLANMKAERDRAWVKICEEIKKAVLE